MAVNANCGHHTKASIYEVELPQPKYANNYCALNVHFPMLFGTSAELHYRLRTAAQRFWPLGISVESKGLRKWSFLSRMHPCVYRQGSIHHFTPLSSCPTAIIKVDVSSLPQTYQLAHPF
jgi:hypothetical protein